MSYLSQFLKVKPVLTSFTADNLDHVMVREGRIFATDDRITVSAPFRSDLEFVVHGETFGEAIKPKDVALSMEGECLVVRHGRSTTRIASAPLKDFLRPIGKWKPQPASMMPAFRALASFQAKDFTREWACGITIRNGKTYATDNQIFGVWEGGGDDIDATFMSWLVNYLIRFKEEPAGYIIEDNWIGFRFEDDTEVRSARLERELTEDAVAVGDSISRRGLPIPFGWFESVSYVSQLPRCDTLTIAPDFMSAKTDEGSRTREIKSPCSKETAWDPKLMKRIAHVATHIDLDAWPKPAPWYGRNVRGIIAGKSLGSTPHPQSTRSP